MMVGALVGNKRQVLHDISNGMSWHAGDMNQIYPAGRLTRQALKRIQQQQQQQLPEPEPMAVDEAMDAMDSADPQSCCRYVRDIYAYLREREQLFRAGPQFMQIQTDINYAMRGILIDWLVEVAEEYRLLPETLHLSVNYIDRFLADVPVARSKLQLVGVACMLIASKYEEINPPHVDEFVYISDNTYRREEILFMESTILNRLQFDLSIATSKVFLNRYLKAARVSGGDERSDFLAMYLAELTLQEYSFLKYSSSEIAASALRLALYTRQVSIWTPLLEQVTGYSTAALQPCVQELLDVYTRAETSNLQAVREKYAQPNCLSVSHFSPPTSVPPALAW